jgi:hypothetical protein
MTSKTALPIHHREMIRAFAADYPAERWLAVADVSLARELGARQLRKPLLTANQSRDIATGNTLRVLAAIWDDIGNIFALLPNGHRIQLIGTGR